MSRARELSKLANPGIFSVDSSNNVGVGSTTPDAKLDVVGVVSATQFFGDGSELSGITAGATLSAGSGDQRIVLTSLTSGTMTTAATDAELSYNSDTDTLSATNVSIAGTLTYEDVKNVDSVGLITARTGVVVSGGDLKVGSAYTVGQSGIVTATAFAGHDYLQAPFGSTVTFAVTVATKDGTHRYKGTGSGNGYLINGVQAPFLTLTPGRTYRFTNDNTGSHPFKFYEEADKTTEYTTGVTFDNAYTEIAISDSTPQVLHYQCSSHEYMGNAVNTNSNVAAGGGGSGISTAAATPSNTVTILDLSSAQDHKLTVTGIVTVTVSGGTEGESHTVRVVNSGVSTVGFSTYFLFPSGSAPSVPTVSGAINLISFTVHKAGSTGIATQLLAGASLNFS